MIRILFVCTGNTCRSPMAEGIARKLIAEGALGDIEASRVRVESAGVGTLSGFPASPEALAVLGDEGIDLGAHRSQTMTADLAMEATVVYCMTRRHYDVVRAMAPDAASKVMLLDPDGGDVDDPIGMDRSFYEQTAKQLRDFIEIRLKELAEQST